MFLMVNENYGAAAPTSMLVKMITVVAAGSGCYQTNTTNIDMCWAPELGHLLSGCGSRVPRCHDLPAWVFLEQECLRNLPPDMQPPWDWVLEQSGKALEVFQS